MKSLQDYIDIYKEIASKLNLRGDSVEVLTQLLANASFISEVENISYAQEASFEKATLINSKIQHCVNDMYSVFRGACPRVILRFTPNKYFNFEMFQNIVSGNGFNIYYLGYLRSNSEDVREGGMLSESTGTKTLSKIKNFVYSPVSIPPAINKEKDIYTIVGLLAKKTVEKSWTLDKDNTYYCDCLEDELSNDMWVKVEDKYYDVTREFSDHIISGNIFDLTLPSFGSRLYVADIFKNGTDIIKDYQESTVPPNTTINAMYYKFSQISDYNLSDLKRISIKGAEMTEFKNDEGNFNLGEFNDPIATGVILVDEVGRDSLNTIHYKASRDRYVNSILRSNSDIGVVLEEMYPDKIRSGGTAYEFFTDDNQSTGIIIYYVPTNKLNLLTENEISDFISRRSSYYIIDNITVEKGKQFTVVFTIDLEIYQNQNVDTEVKSILEQYGNKFDVSIPDSIEEIRSLISKISNVKQILSIETLYMDESGNERSVYEILEDKEHSYLQVECVINSIIR